MVMGSWRRLGRLRVNARRKASSSSGSGCSPAESLRPICGSRFARAVRCTFCAAYYGSSLLYYRCMLPGSSPSQCRPLTDPLAHTSSKPALCCIASR